MAMTGRSEEFVDLVLGVVALLLIKCHALI